MAVQVVETVKKVKLDMTKGTQTISPLVSSVTDEAAYTIGNEIAKLEAHDTEAIYLEIQETLEEVQGE